MRDDKFRKAATTTTTKGIVCRIPVELLSPICDYNMRCRKLSYYHLFRFVHMGIECDGETEIQETKRHQQEQSQMKKVFAREKNIVLVACHVK